MKKLKTVLKRGIILLMSISVLCSTKTIHAYECENEECVEMEEGVTEYVNSENTLQSVETDQIAEEGINYNSDYSSFNEKRETFWYYYQEDSDFIWSLERNGDFQFWRKGDLSTLKLYKQNISEYYPAYNCVFYIENGVDIHMMDYSGENDVLLISASENVKEIVGNREYCFYLTDVGVYRYHIASGTNEFACSVSDGYYLVVFDNQSFRFAEDHGEMAYSEEDGYYSVPDFFIFDMLKKEQGVVNVKDMEKEPTLNRYEERDLWESEEEVNEDSQIEDNLSTYAFNRQEVYLKDTLTADAKSNVNQGLDFTDYGIGKCFTYNHEKCAEDAHKNEDFSNCYKYINDKQCAGYASYAYNLFHGHDKKQTEKIEIYELSGDEQRGVPYSALEWASIPAGTYVRVSLPKAGSGSRTKLRHSFLVYSNDGVNITLYEANADGRCSITEKTLSINSMCINYYPGRFFHPTFAHECVTSSTYSSDDTYHWNTCETGCVDRINRSLHTAGNWYNNGSGHSRNCTVCNRVMESKGHVLSGYLSDGTYHWRECVECGAIVEKSAHNSSNVAASETGHSYSCSICGRPISTTGHTYNSQYNLDASHHWHNCSLAGCSSISGKETHAYSYSRVDASTHKGTCKCGHVITGSHNIRIGQPSSTAHQLICSTCGAVSSETHSYTISQNNGSTHKKTCSKCGYSVSEAHSVVYTNASASSHSLRCSTCGYTETSAHTRITTKTKVATASICTRTAVKCKCNYVISTTTDRTHRYSGKTCLDCGYKK